MRVHSEGSEHVGVRGMEGGVAFREIAAFSETRVVVEGVKIVGGMVGQIRSRQSGFAVGLWSAPPVGVVAVEFLSRGQLREGLCQAPDPVVRVQICKCHEGGHGGWMG